MAIAVMQLLVHPAPSQAADLPQTRELVKRGQYEEALQQATEAVEGAVTGEEWRVLKADLELLLGRYTAARETCTEALQRYTYSIRLHHRLRDAARFSGDQELADAQATEITRLVESSPWRFTDADNLLTLGHIALEMGADAKEIQDAFFTRARRNNPRRPEPLLAIGNLALEKRDYQLAAETFRSAMDAFPNEPDAHYGRRWNRWQTLRI
jgi:tetratricopeptide (TPR) repeat protein